jgi:hypothetical protein
MCKLSENFSRMNAIDIQNQPDRYVISIDKKGVSQEFMLELLERLQLEQLAQKVDFDESILALGNEINANWWQQNKHRFIKE